MTSLNPHNDPGRQEDHVPHLTAQETEALEVKWLVQGHTTCMCRERVPTQMRLAQEPIYSSSTLNGRLHAKALGTHQGLQKHDCL